jgi:hypothetical protein
MLARWLARGTALGVTAAKMMTLYPDKAPPKALTGSVDTVRVKPLEAAREVKAVVAAVPLGPLLVKSRAEKLCTDVKQRTMGSSTSSQQEAALYAIRGSADCKKKQHQRVRDRGREIERVATLVCAAYKW